MPPGLDLRIGLQLGGASQSALPLDGQATLDIDFVDAPPENEPTLDIDFVAGTCRIYEHIPSCRIWS